MKFNFSEEKPSISTSISISISKEHYQLLRYRLRAILYYACSDPKIWPLISSALFWRGLLWLSDVNKRKVIEKGDPK